jgi:diaminohydroxyphosphoribosylaminopyrimidine deaminase/5-amino-6-(5-phosphoribosylamino)uracil reductase
MGEEADGRFLAAAVRLGRSALGTTWPNPAVGAVVVREGVVVGRGRTAAGGRPHAEPHGLYQAGEGARGATLYVSLEPCVHSGRTPPCTAAIAAAGVARVVAALGDPDPRVAGGGFAALRRAGAEAVLIEQEEARAAHAGHLRRVAAGRPHVVLKLAVSADDAIGRRGERQAAVTGVIARRHAQALRSRFDALLVGRGTVEADDPQLTVRLPGLEGRSPVRIVLDSEGRMGASRRVFDGPAPTWVFTADDASERGDGPAGEEGGSHPSGHGIGSRRFRIPRGTGGLDLSACLRRLAEEGVSSVLVEGGAAVARGFLEADLVDEALIFRSPVVLGDAAVSALAGLPLATIEDGSRFAEVDRRRFGEDRMTRYRRRR